MCVYVCCIAMETLCQWCIVLVCGLAMVYVVTKAGYEEVTCTASMFIAFLVVISVCANTDV